MREVRGTVSKYPSSPWRRAGTGSPTCARMKLTAPLSVFFPLAVNSFVTSSWYGLFWANWSSSQRVICSLYAPRPNGPDRVSSQLLHRLAQCRG